MRMFRLVLHALVGAAACAIVMGVLLQQTDAAFALVAHLVTSPVVFSVVSWSYFRSPRHFPMVPTAATFTIAALVVDLLLVRFAHHRHLLDLTGMWVGLTLVFVLVCVVNALLATQPWKRA